MLKKRANCLQGSHVLMWLQAPVCPHGHEQPDCQGWTLPFSSLLAVSQVQEPLPSVSVCWAAHTPSLGRGAGTAGALGAEDVPCLHLALAILECSGAVHLYGKGIFLYVYYTSIKGIKKRNPISVTSAVVRTGFPGSGTSPRKWKWSRGARQVKQRLWATVSTRHKKEQRLTSLTSSRQERSFKVKAKS